MRVRGDGWRWSREAGVVACALALSCTREPPAPVGSTRDEPAQAASSARSSAAVPVPSIADAGTAESPVARADVRITGAQMERQARETLAGWTEATRRRPSEIDAPPPAWVVAEGSGARRSFRVDRAQLAERVAATARELVALLGERERAGVVVERDGADVVLRALPASASAALMGSAPARYEAVLGPHLGELPEGGAIYKVGGTVGTTDLDDHGRGRLDAFLTRVRVPSDLRAVLQTGCGETWSRDVLVELGTAPPLGGAFVRRAFAAPSERKPGATAILVDLTPDAGPGLQRVIDEIAPVNTGVMLAWSSRVLWSSWFANLYPSRVGTRDRPYGTAEDLRAHAVGAGARAWSPQDLRLHADAPSCSTPSAVDVAARIDVVALIEAARSARGAPAR